jgi:hypothetical protein
MKRMVPWIDLLQRKASQHPKKESKKTERIEEGMPGIKDRK